MKLLLLVLASIGVRTGNGRALCLCASVAIQDDPARAALQKLADRLKDVKTLSAKVVQSRKTALLDAPLVSSGTLLYRREPARLVFRMTEPRVTEIHLDRTAYQVYRPDEKRLERIEFENGALMSRLLLVFEPKTDEIGKAFSVRKGAPLKGETEILLEASDEKVRKHLNRLSLVLDDADATLKRIAYIDGEGDEVRFELSDLKLNPELGEAAFELKVPEGTRILKHAPKLEK